MKVKLACYTLVLGKMENIDEFITYIGKRGRKEPSTFTLHHPAGMADRAGTQELERFLRLIEIDRGAHTDSQNGSPSVSQN